MQGAVIIRVIKTGCNSTYRYFRPTAVYPYINSEQRQQIIKSAIKRHKVNNTTVVLSIIPYFITAPAPDTRQTNEYNINTRQGVFKRCNK